MNRQPEPDTMRFDLSFRKMHGLGNDFAIIDLRESDLRLTPEHIRRIADRRRGVGCDQVITLEPPRTEGAALFMRVGNPDGSESGACGNATRCVASLILDSTGGQAVIETSSGLLSVAWASPERTLVTGDMGPARLEWSAIPLASAQDTLHLAIGAGPLQDAVAVSMGNPHAVFFVPDAEAIPLEVVGPVLEHHPLFPERTNVEAVSVIDRTHLRMRVWERGAGITQACGTGACATVVAAVRRGLAERKAEVCLDGGVLTLEWRESDGHVLMTGPFATSYSGTLSETLLA